MLFGLSDARTTVASGSGVGMGLLSGAGSPVLLTHLCILVCIRCSVHIEGIILVVVSKIKFIFL